MERIVLPLPPEMLRQVDEARRGPLGDTPRTVWIRSAIQRGLLLSCPTPGCDFVTYDPSRRCPHDGRLPAREI